MRALEAIAAGHDLSPLRARDLVVARNGLELVVTGNRADLDIRIESMADFERAHLLAKQGHEPVMYAGGRSEEHTSELQSLMRISYAVFCLKKTTTLTPSTQIF